MSDHPTAAVAPIWPLARPGRGQAPPLHVLGDAGQRPVGDAGQRPVGDAGQRPVGDAGQRPVGDAGQRPFDDARQRPFGDAGQGLVPCPLHHSSAHAFSSVCFAFAITPSDVSLSCTPCGRTSNATMFFWPWAT